MGAGEVLGGVLSPFLAGQLADVYGLSAALWLMLVLTVLAGLCALGLVESAPRVLARRKPAIA
jgi:MFS family permease